MTWTFDQAPGTATAAQRRDAVRHLIGDTLTTDQQVSDEAIAFTLSECGNNIYGAAAFSCRLISAKYARLVDTEVDDGGIIAKYSQRRDAYRLLAVQIETQAKKIGTQSLGVPAAGGISISDVDSAHRNTDRPTAAFGVTPEAVDELRS